LHVCCQPPPRKLEDLLGFAVQSPTKVKSLLMEPNFALQADMTIKPDQPATLMLSFHIAVTGVLMPAFPVWLLQA